MFDLQVAVGAAAAAAAAAEEFSFTDLAPKRKDPDPVDNIMINWTVDIFLKGQ